jgi:hypothetical protein
VKFLNRTYKLIRNKRIYFVLLVHFTPKIWQLILLYALFSSRFCSWLLWISSCSRAVFNTKDTKSCISVYKSHVDECWLLNALVLKYIANIGCKIRELWAICFAHLSTLWKKLLFTWSDIVDRSFYHDFPELKTLWLY